MKQVKLVDDALLKTYETDGIRGYWKKEMQINVEAQKNDPCALAESYARGGEINLAFEWLEECYEKHGLMMTFLKYQSNFDSLHSDPRWNDLLRRVGFPDDTHSR